MFLVCVHKNGFSSVLHTHIFYEDCFLKVHTQVKCVKYVGLLQLQNSPSCLNKFETVIHKTINTNWKIADDVSYNV